MKRVIISSTDAYQRGYDKAMELMNYDTYMYDSSRRIYELSKKDPEYETAGTEYRGGFAAAVYNMFRC